MTWSISIVEKYEMCCRLHFAKILFSEDFYMKKWNVVSIKGDDFFLMIIWQITHRFICYPWTWCIICVVINKSITRIVSYSQWWGLGGNSLGCATVELAKLLKAADEGLMHRGTRFEFIWLSINRCSLSLTLLTQVKSLSHSSSKARSATGS